ncbi:MAG: HEAT repeat domain-containing protein [Candidatus Aminicenantes bacterium]|nr:HEAT repeat domain-containing protein [Candidatus Aminicenantes bacterium]
MKDKIFLTAAIIIIFVHAFTPFTVLSQDNQKRDVNTQPSAAPVVDQNHKAKGNPDPTEPDKKTDFDKEEVYRYVERIYQKHADSVNNFLSIAQYILFGIGIVLTAIGWLNYRSSYKDREFIENLINRRINDYKEIFSERIKTVESILEELHKKTSEFKKKIEDSYREMDNLRKDALLVRDFQTYYNKLFSRNIEEIIDGMTKITDSYYYSPLAHRKIKELSASENDSVKFAALRALAVFGDKNALKSLTELAKTNEEAKTTLEHLKKEYPDL